MKKYLVSLIVLGLMSCASTNRGVAQENPDQVTGNIKTVGNFAFTEGSTDVAEFQLIDYGSVNGHSQGVTLNTEGKIAQAMFDKMTNPVAKELVTGTCVIDNKTGATIPAKFEKRKGETFTCTKRAEPKCLTAVLYQCVSVMNLSRGLGSPNR